MLSVENLFMIPHTRDTLLSVHNVVLCGVRVYAVPTSSVCCRDSFTLHEVFNSWVSVSDEHSSANPGAPLKLLQEQLGLETGIFWWERFLWSTQEFLASCIQNDPVSSSPEVRELTREVPSVDALGVGGYYCWFSGKPEPH